MEFVEDQLKEAWEHSDNPVSEIEMLAQSFIANNNPLAAGDAYFFLGDKAQLKYYDKALEQYLLFLEWVRDVIPEDTYWMATANRKVGEACMWSFTTCLHEDLAEEYLMEAYAIYKTHPFRFAKELVMTCNMLSIVFFSSAAEYSSDEVAQAIAFDLEAIHFLEEYRPREHEWAAEQYESLAYKYHCRGETQNENDCYKKALSLRFLGFNPSMYQGRFYS